MQLPFTTEQFYAVFRDYNTALWPAQVFLLSLAAAAIALVAWLLGVPQDLGLGLVAVVSIVLLATSRSPAARAGVMS